MRRYETIVIVDPDLTEDGRAPLLERIEGIIPQQGGFVVEVDAWGNRKLAYEIKKKPRGYYYRLDYCGTGDAVSELERFFKIDDRILKFLTVLLDQEADVEQLKADIAEAKAQKEALAAKKAEEAKAAREAQAARAAEAAKKAQAAAADKSSTADKSAQTDESVEADASAPADKSAQADKPAETDQADAAADGDPEPVTETAPGKDADAAPADATDTPETPETEEEK